MPFVPLNTVTVTDRLNISSCFFFCLHSAEHTVDNTLNNDRQTTVLTGMWLSLLWLSESLVVV